MWNKKGELLLFFINVEGKVEKISSIEIKKRVMQLKPSCKTFWKEFFFLPYSSNYSSPIRINLDLTFVK